MILKKYQDALDNFSIAIHLNPLRGIGKELINIIRVKKQNRLFGKSRLFKIFEKI